MRSGLKSIEVYHKVVNSHETTCNPAPSRGFAETSIPSEIVDLIWWRRFPGRKVSLTHGPDQSNLAGAGMAFAHTCYSTSRAAWQSNVTALQRRHGA
jgi:hypothetical protein